jgi:protein-tyrosine phosphatase
MSNDIRLVGAPNFRDIGGCETSDGYRVRTGWMFRSGELSNLLESDIEVLRHLRVGCLVDLRSERERDVHVSRLPDGLVKAHHHANIAVNAQVGGRPIFELLRECATPDDAAGLVRHTFTKMPAQCGPALGYITETLARSQMPVLFHCTNGRDRTGVVAALLLALLGATREAIVADFMLTNERIDVEKVVENSIEVFRKAGMEVDRRTMELVTLVRPQLIDAMFERIDAEYGELDNYFEAFGIDAKRRETLRELLIVTN